MNRRGIALLVAIGFLTILGGIAASALALAVAERRAGAGALAAVQVQGAAEGALARALSGVPPSLMPGSPGAESRLLDFSGAGGATARATIRGLGAAVFALRAEARRGSTGGIEQAHAAIELLIRLDSIASDSMLRPRAITRAWSRVFP